MYISRYLLLIISRYLPICKQDNKVGRGRENEREREEGRDVEEGVKGEEEEEKSRGRRGGGGESASVLRDTFLWSQLIWQIGPILTFSQPNKKCPLCPLPNLPPHLLYPSSSHPLSSFLAPPKIFNLESIRHFVRPINFLVLTFVRHDVKKNDESHDEERMIMMRMIIVARI